MKMMLTPIVCLSVMLAACTPAQLATGLDIAIQTDVAGKAIDFAADTTTRVRESRRVERLSKSFRYLCTDVRQEEFDVLPEVEKVGLASFCNRWRMTR